MGRLVVSLVLFGAAAVGAWLWFVGPHPDSPVDIQKPRRSLSRDEMARMRLYQELQPVRLANCTLARYGEAHDGGYLLCADLLGDVASAYSYGIDGFDGWGCDVSRSLGVRVHQYDCFNLTEPLCPGGDTVFHGDCIAAEPLTDPDGRRFDTLERQVAANGDTGNRLLVKMDVEGAEWESVLAAPDALLARIDQLVVELHGVEKDVQRKLDAVLRLKGFFHVAHLHFNNFRCLEGLAPFPSDTYEVLFVNRRLGVLAEDQSPVPRPHPLDTPTSPERPDCQYAR